MKEFLKLLTFEKVIAKRLVASFVWNTVYVCLVMLCRCRSPELKECAIRAVSEQCGEETAERMRALGERLINIGCTPCCK